MATRTNSAATEAAPGVDAILAYCRQRLAEEADPVFQQGQLHFFKSGSQEKESIRNYGVRGVPLKQIEKELYKQVKPLPLAARNRFCEELWQGGTLEEGGLAIYLYRRFARQCGREEFRMFERWLDKYVHNWAHTDGVSSWLLSACIANVPELRFELRCWTTSPNRWKRRSAAVSLLREGKYGPRIEYVFEIAEKLRCDADDMVQKGVGWLLKETYPNHKRQTLEFLTSRPAPFARTVLRYAAEKMTPADRAAVLGGAR